MEKKENMRYRMRCRCCVRLETMRVIRQSGSRNGRRRRRGKNAATAAVLSMQTQCVITILDTSNCFFSPALFRCKCVRACVYYMVVAIVAAAASASAVIAVHTPVFP